MLYEDFWSTHNARGFDWHVAREYEAWQTKIKVVSDWKDEITVKIFRVEIYLANSFYEIKGSSQFEIFEKSIFVFFKIVVWSLRNKI